MKVIGLIVVVLGFVVLYIGITGSQHRVMNILKSIHLAPASAAKSASSSNNQGAK